MRLRALILDFGGLLTLDFWDALRGFCRREGLTEDALVDLVTTDLDGRRMLADLERGAVGQREFESYVGERLGSASPEAKVGAAAGGVVWPAPVRVSPPVLRWPPWEANHAQ